MNILGIECSSVTASVCVASEGKVISEFFLNAGLTHSQTLMPLIKGAIDFSGLELGDIDTLAVSVGPGSFTGLRIGIAASKGIAHPLRLPCLPISTLETIAFPLSGIDCIVCSVMDARCSQVYCAIFESYNNNLKRLTDDSAIMLSDLKKFLLSFSGKPIILIGDGAKISYDFLKVDFPNLKLSNSQMQFQRASSVALLADHKLMNGEKTISAFDLIPTYLRIPQAERELKKRR